MGVKRDDVTLGLGVLGLEVPRVVMEVVCADVLATALVDFRESLLGGFSLLLKIF